MTLWVDRTYELYKMKLESLGDLLIGVTQGGDETNTITECTVEYACRKAEVEAKHLLE